MLIVTFVHTVKMSIRKLHVFERIESYSQSEAKWNRYFKSCGKKRTDLAYGREGFRNDILLTLKSVPERHVRVLIVTSELGVNNITTRMAGHAKRKRYVYILSILTGFRKSDNCYLP